MSRKLNIPLLLQYKIAHPDHQPDVRINGHSADKVRSHRYLGVEIDDTETWHSQIDQVVKKSVSWPGNSKAGQGPSTARYLN